MLTAGLDNTVRFWNFETKICLGFYKRTFDTEHQHDKDDFLNVQCTFLTNFRTLLSVWILYFRDQHTKNCSLFILCKMKLKHRVVSTVGINHLDLGHFELLSQLLTFIVTLSFSVHKLISFSVVQRFFWKETRKI